MNLSAHYYLGQFCDKPAERLARIHRVELLNDMRIVDWDLHVHLKHEFLVFSLSYNGEGSLLYFEHWWGDDSEVPVAHRSAEELDELMSRLFFFGRHMSMIDVVDQGMLRLLWKEG
jgi:hypothetical protein